MLTLFHVYHSIAQRGNKAFAKEFPASRYFQLIASHDRGVASQIDLSSFVSHHRPPTILSIILTFYSQISSLQRERDVPRWLLCPFNLRGAIQCRALRPRMQRASTRRRRMTARELGWRFIFVILRKSVER